jgi:hypothetical protein
MKLFPGPPKVFGAKAQIVALFDSAQIFPAPEGRLMPASLHPHLAT